MDRRQTKTKKLIKDAYLNLLREKPINKITVTEIAKKANIERKTFYLHYSCTDDIIFEYEQDYYTFIMKYLGKYVNQPQYGIHDILNRINRILIHLFPFLNQLSRNEASRLVLKTFIERMIKTVIKEFLLKHYELTKSKIDYYVEFYSSGLSSLYMGYISDPSIEIKELSKIAYNVCFNGVDNILSKKKRLS